MPTRRQEKVARVVKEVVSNAIAGNLNDPRIRGFVSVTRVDVASDLRSAEVYLSVFATGHYVHEHHPRAGDKGAGGSEKLTFEAINSARNRIQALLAAKMQARFCPVISFHRDEQFKQTLQTMQLIDRVAGELEDEDTAETLESEDNP